MKELGWYAASVAGVGLLVIVEGTLVMSPILISGWWFLS